MAKLRVSYEYTEAEDKSIRLGLFLIVSGILSLFIFGFCWLSPALQDLQATAANCTVLSVQQIGEVFECTFTCGTDCRGTSQYPCVQVYVNNSESNSRALLHSDQHQLLTNPKCSYIPPCKRENQKNSESVMNWQQYWKDEIGSQPFTCYFNQHQRPEDVLLQRTHDEIALLHCFLWPVVAFVYPCCLSNIETILKCRVPRNQEREKNRRVGITQRTMKSVLMLIQLSLIN
ncbi:calcium-activated potassium channel subunit beta-4 isoform X1 [Mus caroli]|uniref:Calcium-activated potassium channel subunit beta n=1 Tax=Mus caroli TaxID=10089 RepID=A0A6P5QBM0_MUSCR|nr:calcium-activated potassium channel subunit beta-4 isoform X1 [Mus caroli]